MIWLIFSVYIIEILLLCRRENTKENTLLYIFLVLLLILFVLPKNPKKIHNGFVRESV